MEWLCDQIPELRPARRHLVGRIDRRKIYKRTGSREEYLVSTFDHVCGSLSEPADALGNSEQGTFRDIDVGDDAESDASPVAGVDAGSYDPPASGSAVEGELEVGASGEVDSGHGGNFGER